jgi:hypothetical protein
VAHVFSSFSGIEHSDLPPKRLLGRLADADFLQQIKKNLLARGRHVAELAFVKVVDRLIKGL